MLTQQAAEVEHDGGSSMDQACTKAQGSHTKHDGLLAQLSQQLTALQKWQAEAASAADVRILDKQGAPTHHCLHVPNVSTQQSEAYSRDTQFC